MKTNALRSKLLAGAALALGTGLAIPTAIAGPGADYWRNLGKSENATTVAPAAPTPHINRACADSRFVSVTETKPAWHNGRGPLQTVEVGKKLVCTSCDIPMIVMKPAGHNGRGAMAPVAVKGTHDCSKSGCGGTVARVD